MSDLRTMLEEYITDINEILQSCANDDEIRNAAIEKWQSDDRRFLVFTMTDAGNMLLAPIPPKNAGGCDINISNELPSSPPQLTPVKDDTVSTAKESEQIPNIKK